METKANYALIGAFVLMAFIAAVAFIAWLSGSQFDQEFEEYDVIFSGAVRGLSQGAEVRYNGLRVGEVTRLSLDPDNSNTVVAQIEIDANTPVHTNSEARLEPLGLTGLSYIQIFSGGDEFPLLRDLGDGPYEIPGEGSAIDTIIEGGGDVVTSATIALSRATELLSPDAIADFQAILANTNRLTGKLADTDIDPEAVEGLLASITATADQATATLKTYEALGADAQRVLDEDVDRLLDRVDVTLTNIDTAVDGYGALAGDGQELVADARDAINRLSNSGLTDIEETTNSLRELTASLSRIADELEANPLQFIVGDERTSVEIPQ